MKISFDCPVHMEGFMQLRTKKSHMVADFDGASLIITESRLVPKRTFPVQINLEIFEKSGFSEVLQNRMQFAVDLINGFDLT
jgi:hypothetical protein